MGLEVRAFIRRVDLDHPGPLRRRILHDGLQAIVMPLVDDGCVIRIVYERGKHADNGLGGPSHKLVTEVSRHQDIVWCEAYLAGAHCFAPHHATGREMEVCASADDNRRLATQFEREGH